MDVVAQSTEATVRRPLWSNIKRHSPQYAGVDQ